jgi:hypothetical protein
MNANNVSRPLTLMPYVLTHLPFIIDHLALFYTTQLSKVNFAEDPGDVWPPPTKVMSGGGSGGGGQPVDRASKR